MTQFCYLYRAADSGISSIDASRLLSSSTFERRIELFFRFECKQEKISIAEKKEKFCVVQFYGLEKFSTCDFFLSFC